MNIENLRYSVTIDNTYSPKYTDEKSWLQCNSNEIITLPINKPDIRRVENIFAYSSINSKKIIITPNSSGIPSLNGSCLRGFSLSVYGTIYEKILYVSNDRENPLVYFNLKIPFVKNIVLSPKTNIQKDKLCVKIFIEDIYTEIIDPRTILSNASIYLEAKNICNESSKP